MLPTLFCRCYCRYAICHADTADAFTLFALPGFDASRRLFRAIFATYTYADACRFRHAYRYCRFDAAARHAAKSMPP